MDGAEQPNPQFSRGAMPQWLGTLLGISLALFGGLATAIHLFFLCFYTASRIGGGHPFPQILTLTISWVTLGAAPLAAGVVLLRTKPSTKRFWWRILLGVLLLILVVGVDGTAGPANWYQLFRREHFAGTDAARLKQTVVSPTLDAKISKGTNLLWCGTFQLAWNEACRLAGGDLQFDRGHPVIEALNKHEFTKESIDEGSYVAMSGFVKDNIHAEIGKAVKEKFHGMFKSRFVPDNALTPRPQDLVAYACLYKTWSFQHLLSDLTTRSHSTEQKCRLSDWVDTRQLLRKYIRRY